MAGVLKTSPAGETPRGLQLITPNTVASTTRCMMLVPTRTRRVFTEFAPYEAATLPTSKRLANDCAASDSTIV